MKINLIAGIGGLLSAASCAPFWASGTAIMLSSVNFGFAVINLGLWWWMRPRTVAVTSTNRHTATDDRLL
jgi:hypothetical protein